jgi:hypothetical protein
MAAKSNFLIELDLAATDLTTHFMPAADQYVIVISQSKPVATLNTWLPNMPKNTTTHQKRIQHAMQVLLKNGNLSMPPQ